MNSLTRYAMAQLVEESGGVMAVQIGIRSVYELRGPVFVLREPEPEGQNVLVVDVAREVANEEENLP